MLDYKSPYFKYAERDKREAALVDSGLTEKDLQDPLFKAAYHKYDEIQNCDPFLELIRTAFKTLRKTRIFLDNIDYNNDVDSEGRPLYKPADVIKDIGSIGKMRVQLQELEENYNSIICNTNTDSTQVKEYQTKLNELLLPLNEKITENLLEFLDKTSTCFK